MKKILAILWKDTLLRFATPAEWIFFLVLPIVFTLVLGGGTGGNVDNRVRLLVVDQAETPLAQEIIGALEQSEAVRPEVIPLTEAESEFNARRASAMLIIPIDLSQDASQREPTVLELRQQPNNLNALVAEQAVLAIISRVGRAYEIANSSVTIAKNIQAFESEETRQVFFEAALDQAKELLNEIPDRVNTIQANTEDPVEYDPRVNSSAGQLITWVFIPLIGISGMFAYERQKGTLRRLLTTPTSKATYLLGSIIGQFVTALLQMGVLVAFGIWVMKLNWGHDLAGLIVILAASALAAVALGTTLGTFVKTESQASGLSIMLGMVMALFGGCWYPLELFPEIVRNLVKVLPTTWAMQGMLDLVLRGRGLVAILPEAGVLCGFAAIFFVIGIWRFRYE